MIEKIAKTAREKVDGALEIIEAEKAEDVIESKLKKAPQKTLKISKTSVKTFNIATRKFGSKKEQLKKAKAIINKKSKRERITEAAKEMAIGIAKGTKNAVKAIICQTSRLYHNFFTYEQYTLAIVKKR